MEHKKTYDLISDLLAFLVSDDFAATIPSLSKVCHVPIAYVRKFLLCMIKNTVFSACLDGEPEDQKTSLTFFEQYEKSPKEAEKALLQGTYDAYLWTVDLKLLREGEDQLLGLTTLEYHGVSSLKELDSTFHQNALYEKKNPILQVDKSLRKNQEIIQTAIETHTAISFSYRDREGTLEKHRGFPIRIVTDITDNWIYFVMANQKNTYRLDRLRGTVKQERNCGPYPKVTEDPNRKYMWGSSFTEGDTPTHVKILISDNLPNLLQKIQNDIRHREGLCSFYKKDGRYYYEDDIIGISEFRRWLRGYGSSLQVIEPAFLREDIIGAVKDTLARYEAAKAWGEV